MGKNSPVVDGMYLNQSHEEITFYNDRFPMGMLTHFDDDL